MDSLIIRQAAIDECNKRGAEHIGYAIAHLPSAQPELSTEIQEILNYLDATLHPIVSPDNWDVYAELHDMVSMLPSAQPEIIRCKDCRYSEYDALYDDRYCHYDGKADIVPDEHYCGYAERRTDEGD